MGLLINEAIFWIGCANLKTIAIPNHEIELNTEFYMFFNELSVSVLTDVKSGIIVDSDASSRNDRGKLHNRYRK